MGNFLWGIPQSNVLDILQGHSERNWLGERLGERNELGACGSFKKYLLFVGAAKPQTMPQAGKLTCKVAKSHILTVSFYTEKHPSSCKYALPAKGRSPVVRNSF